MFGSAPGNRGYCEIAGERAHTKSLDANDKLIQTRSHVRDITASRKRQVIMRKGKSTIDLKLRKTSSIMIDILSIDISRQPTVPVRAEFVTAPCRTVVAATKTKSRSRLDMRNILRVSLTTVIRGHLFVAIQAKIFH